MAKTNGIRILHLSDFHFNAAKAWDAEPVRRDLANFIGKEVETDGAPDLVVITGDLAFSGIADEYALAERWLGDLWNKLGDLPRDRLLLVPGNHDVDRTKVGSGVRFMQDGLLVKRSQQQIADLLTNEDEQGPMLKRHTAYLDFVADWLGERQALPWWQRLINIRGTTLHVPASTPPGWPAATVMPRNCCSGTTN